MGARLSDDIKEQIAALKEQLAQLEKKALDEDVKKENPKVSVDNASVGFGNEVSDLPREPKGSDSTLKWMFGTGAAIVVLFLIMSIANKSPNPSTQNSTLNNSSSANALNVADEVAKTAQDATNAVAEAAGNTEKSGTKWEYDSSSDGMSDIQTKTACIESEDMIIQSAPYEPTHTRLCFRKSPKYGFDAYFTLESDGQILCQSYVEPCTITVRFDKNAAQSFSGTSASDNSSDIVFFVNAQRLLSSVLKSKQTRVQVELFQNGNQATTFNTEGLVWPPK